MSICTSCSLLGSFIPESLRSVGKEIHTITQGPTLTPQQAKDEVYATAREIISAIPQEVADIVKVKFKYESGNDNEAPPFRAVIGILIDNRPSYNNEHITDTYRNILLKLPGYCDDNGNYHSHAPIVIKGDQRINLPIYNVYWAFKINGPLHVYEDLREIPEHWDNGLAEVHGPLMSEDVTADFLPLKETMGQRRNP